MQRRGKHTSITAEELLEDCIFCWGRPEALQRGLQASYKYNWGSLLQWQSKMMEKRIFSVSYSYSGLWSVVTSCISVQ
jgi:hypothetical protein